MIEITYQNPFNELPEALVVDMLGQCDEIGLKLSRSFHKLYNLKSEIRKTLKQEEILKKDSQIMLPQSHPTSCAVDGSYSIEKLLSTDIVASAGVGVEGLAPPTEERKWLRPRHYSKIFTVTHSISTNYLANAIMMCMELSLAGKAPHDVVFFDGSFATPLVSINQAFSYLNGTSEDLKREFNKRLKIALAAYIKMLSSKKTDQIFAAVPKYTTRQELTKGILNLNSDFEDRGLLSFVLKPGEIVGPIKTEVGIRRRNIENAPPDAESFINSILQLLNETFIFYYRPYDHMPALRLEVSPNVANNRSRLSILLESLKLQCGVPGLMEPFPLYLADRMVKHMRTALPAIRKTTTQEMCLNWKGEYSDLFFAMHGYRTEFGK